MTSFINLLLSMFLYVKSRPIFSVFLCKYKYKYKITDEKRIIDATAIAGSIIKIPIVTIINNEISLKDRDDDELENELEEKNYNKKGTETGKQSYDYLLSIQVRHMTGQRLKELENKERQVVEELNNYKKLTATDIWIKELDELLKKYKLWMKD